MNENTRIAWGIVGAAGILLFGFIAYREWSRQRDIDEAQQALQGIVQMGQQALAQSAVQTREWNERQAAKARAESLRYDLGPGQQCVGGVVLEVHGNVYTQVGSIAEPIHCAGRRADRPLR